VITETEIDQLADAAEVLYGPRDRSYELIGVRFEARGPLIFYPAGKQVEVILSEAAKVYRPTALFEAAHEAVHLLAPTGGSHATVLEEGLATHFSHSICAAVGNPYRTSIACFIQAEALFHRLLLMRADAVALARHIEPNFVGITAGLLRQIVPGLDDSVAETLCLPFGPWSEKFGGIGRDI